MDVIVASVASVGFTVAVVGASVASVGFIVAGAEASVASVGFTMSPLGMNAAAKVVSPALQV